ncbi:DgyrCDS10055 [Dimorphilus gyrociliatus]|uniref:DgyrCDS10055 n=1 Tax=Dimorphilus gyrociliatus TaxID=2664684 RepID=A0A7I8VZ00_9ANNE|nr:DgyrCDS10055 [Dimorphilus gyrociliatus]
MNSKKDKGYAWVIAINGMVLNMLSVLGLASQSVLIIFITESLGESYSKVSLITSFLNMFFGAGGFLFGFLGKKFSPRSILIGGSLLLCSCSVVTCFVRNIYVYYLTLGVGSGIGVASFVYCGTITIAEWFDRYKAMALSISAVGASAGFFIWTPITSILVDTFGWRSTYLIIAGIYLQGCCLAMLIKKAPQNMNITICKTDHVNPRLFNIKIFKNLPLVLFYLSLTCTYIGQTVPYFWIPTRAERSGIGLRMGTLIVSITSASCGIFTLIAGFLGDRPSFNRILGFGINSGLTGLLSIFSTLSHSVIILMSYGFLFGLTSGFYQALNMTVVTDLVQLNDLPCAIGLDVFCIGSAQCLCIPLGAMLFDISGSSMIPFIVKGTIQGFFGPLFAILALITHRRRGIQYKL